VDPSAVGDGTEVIARQRQRRSHAPAVVRRIVDFVCNDGVALRVASADGVDPPVERDHTGRPARSAERCEGAPPVGCRVVLEDPVHGADVNVGDEPQ
jgi:hypothetical protein